MAQTITTVVVPHASVQNAGASSQNAQPKRLRATSVQLKPGLGSYIPWAGAKSWSYEVLHKRIPAGAKRLVFACAGAGSDAVAYAAIGLPMVLADLNPDLICAHQFVQKNPANAITALVKLFTAENNTKARYYELRAEFNRTPKNTPRRAALFIYLLWHCMSGICRYNGILDTVKKFADIMNKKSGTQFGEVIRQFSMHGGTIIGLAHVNKHRNDDGQVIYSGTSDLVDDCDCAYTLDVVSSDASSRLRTVKFTNIKNRGDVALEASYQYDYTEDLSYQERLDSVKALSEKDTVAADAQKAMDSMNERNHDAVIAIREVILSGINKKTELIKAAVEASGLTKKAIVEALKDHTGKSLAKYQYWHVTVKEDNAHVYTLNS